MLALGHKINGIGEKRRFGNIVKLDLELDPKYLVKVCCKSTYD